MKYKIQWYAGNSTCGQGHDRTITGAKRYGYRVSRGNACPGDSYGYSIYLYDNDNDPVIMRSFKKAK